MLHKKPPLFNLLLQRFANDCFEKLKSSLKQHKLLLKSLFHAEIRSHIRSWFQTMVECQLLNKFEHNKKWIIKIIAMEKANVLSQEKW